MKSIELSEFFFEGKVGDFKVGSSSHSSSHSYAIVCVIENLGRGLPALYSWNDGVLDYTITILNGIVVGISLSVRWYSDIMFTITYKGQSMDFGAKTNVGDFVKWLNDVNIDWSLDKMESGKKNIAILLPSNTSVTYSFERDSFGFDTIENFDRALYDKIPRGSIK